MDPGAGVGPAALDPAPQELWSACCTCCMSRCIVPARPRPWAWSLPCAGPSPWPEPRARRTSVACCIAAVCCCVTGGRAEACAGASPLSSPAAAGSTLEGGPTARTEGAGARGVPGGEGSTLGGTALGVPRMPWGPALLQLLPLASVLRLPAAAAEPEGACRALLPAGAPAGPRERASGKLVTAAAAFADLRRIEGWAHAMALPGCCVAGWLSLPSDCKDFAAIGAGTGGAMHAGRQRPTQRVPDHGAKCRGMLQKPDPLWPRHPERHASRDGDELTESATTTPARSGDNCSR